MRALFVCSRNRRRSLTAEAIFAGEDGIEALSAGTNADAETVVSQDLIEWADVIVAMERTHQRKLQARFGPLLRAKKVIVLGIDDDYEFMDERLVQILKQKFKAHVK